MDIAEYEDFVQSDGVIVGTNMDKSTFLIQENILKFIKDIKISFEGCYAKN